MDLAQMANHQNPSDWEGQVDEAGHQEGPQPDMINMDYLAFTCRVGFHLICNLTDFANDLIGRGQ